MPRTYPNESTEYRDARTRLATLEQQANALQARVAAKRRALPRGGEVSADYQFERLAGDGTTESVPLSALFGDAETLIVYSMMFGPERARGCPFCTAYLTQLDHAVGQLGDKAAFVVAARSPLQRLVDHATANGWNHITMVSDGSSTFHADYHGTSLENGQDEATLNVFVREGDQVFHHWGAEDEEQPNSEAWFDPFDNVANLQGLVPERQPVTV